MNIEFISSNDNFQESHDYRSFFGVKVDGEKFMFFLDGEPEDANLGRDFSDIYKLPALLSKVVAAAQSGESIKFLLNSGDSW